MASRFERPLLLTTWLSSVLLICLGLACEANQPDTRATDTGSPVDSGQAGGGRFDPPVPVFRMDGISPVSPYPMPPSDTSASTDRPFASKSLFVNPIYTQAVDYMADPELGGFVGPSDVLRALPTAYWFTRFEDQADWLRYMELASEQADSFSGTIRTVLVLNGFFAEDCLRADSMDDSAFATYYREQYIAAIETALRRARKLETVVILEPRIFERLLNPQGNSPETLCVTKHDRATYLSLLGETLDRLAFFPAVQTYVDVGHAGVFGKEDAIRDELVQVLKALLKDRKIRGFATNIGDFTPWEDKGKIYQPSFYEGSLQTDEQSYISSLAEDLQAVDLPLHFVVDSSRNAPVKARSHWRQYCNLSEAKAGPLPRLGASKLIDAFLWLKAPGVSDGSSAAASLQASCGSLDSFVAPPAFGAWFPRYYKSLFSGWKPSL